MSLASLLAPASVAVLGASQNPDKIGGRPIRFMKEQGFQGRIYPINPSRSEIQGLPAFPDLAALPEAPEAVIIAVAGLREVTAAVETCAALGVKACVIMSSGFAETGPEGEAAQQHLLRTARAAGLRLIGPNSQGVANFGTGAVLNFSTMFVERPPQTGPVAIISQSGAMSVVPYGLLRNRGIGISHCHATGNDADITACELAAEVVLDPAVKLCLLYLETLRDPEQLALAAARARARGVPVIALKSGRSAEGARAAASHTGAIASEDRVVDAFLARHGIWRAAGTEDFVQATELYLKGWIPGGRRVAVVSNSGATCVLATDALARCGLELAQFSPQTEAALRAVLPAFAASRNPVDLTAALLSDSGLFGKVLPEIGRDGGVDALVLGLPVSGRGYDYPRFARDAEAFAAATGLPVVFASPQPEVLDAFRARGLPAFETEDAAVRALSQFIHHHELIRAAQAAPPPLPAAGPGNTAAAPGRLLDEEQSLRRLAEAGVPVPRRRICLTLAEALDARPALGGTVVMKALSDAIAHKSDHGLVWLNLRDDAALAEAFTSIEARVRALGVPFTGVLLAEMLAPGTELMAGGHVDPVFGPVLVFGAGGVTVEAMPDNQLLLLPLQRAEFDAALSRLHLAPLFGALRGAAPLDREALWQVLCALEGLFRSGGALSVDVNPLITRASGTCAADALLELAPG